MKKTILRTILIMFLGYIVYIAGYQFIYLSMPSRISKELQGKITETAGKGYELIYPAHEDSHINYVEIGVAPELFQNKKVLAGCNQLKDVVYEFAAEYPDNFELFPASAKEINENISGARGFEINFVMSGEEEIQGRSNGGFLFSNFLDYYYHGRYSDKMNYMCVGGPAIEGNFLLSDLLTIEGIEELEVSEAVMIDDPEVLGKMKSLWSCVKI